MKTKLIVNWNQVVAISVVRREGGITDITWEGDRMKFDQGETIEILYGTGTIQTPQAGANASAKLADDGVLVFENLTES